MYLSRYSDLPKQTFHVFYYAPAKKGTKKTWQEQYRIRRARGVWTFLGTVTARSPWAACSIMRERLGLKREDYLKMKALPTWKEA